VSTIEKEQLRLRRAISGALGKKYAFFAVDFDSVICFKITKMRNFNKKSLKKSKKILKISKTFK